MGLMTELIVVTGPPGAGKTIVALSSMFEHSARVGADEFFAFIDRSAPPEQDRDQRGRGGGRSACPRWLHRRLRRVIGPWFVDAFDRAAGLTRLHYALLLPPEQLCLQRVESRVGHGFTDLARMDRAVW